MFSALIVQRSMDVICRPRSDCSKIVSARSSLHGAPRALREREWVDRLRRAPLCAEANYRVRTTLWV